MNFGFSILDFGLKSRVGWVIDPSVKTQPAQQMGQMTHPTLSPRPETRDPKPDPPRTVRIAGVSILILCLLLGTGCQKTTPTATEATSKAPPVIKTKTGVEMVLVPAGSFTMGSAQGGPDERPPHKVSVDSFLIDKYEITQEQYDKLVPAGSMSHFKGPKRPVEQMSWVRAVFYCNARSRAEGLEPCYNEETGDCNFQASGYRLPTEAEWEYACRAGSDGDYFFGSDARRLDEYAWHAANSGKTTHPVGQKKPNAWGIHDMVGNVAEWCNDVYDEGYYKTSPEKNPTGPVKGTKYVLRGGAYNSTAKACRSSYRVGEAPGTYDGCFGGDHLGARCVRRP
jgi:formylglycine-generating enzyme required for sulfatase activity